MFCSLHIPDFPVMAALRGDGSVGEGACAVLAGGGEGITGKVRDKLPILALNREGWYAGIAPGWALGRALVRCPGLRVIVRDPEAEAKLRGELFFLAETVSADVEMTAEDAVVMDLGMVRGWKDGMFDRLHLDGAEVCWSVAETPDLAHLAVRFGETQGRVVSAEDMRALPVGALGALGGGGRTLELLEMWGLGNLGDFMKLPRQGLAERLGPEAGRWHDVLHGKVCRLLRLHRMPESFAQEMDFEEPLGELDRVVFALKRMLHVLAGRLAARHLAAGFLELRIFMERGGEEMRRLRFSEPQTGVEGMLAPLQTMMDAVKLESPVVRLTLDAETTFATAAQREWFGKNLPQPERWAETVAKLEAMLGRGRVGVPVREDTFRADAFSVKEVGEKVTKEAVFKTTLHEADCALPLRRFRPPHEVAVAHEAGGRFPVPLAILSGMHKGEILRKRGPFLSSGAWWDAAVAWQRLEWDVELRDGMGRLAFVKPERWLVEGIYE
jgi:protein ImuB